jgi:hypothetical protein
VIARGPIETSIERRFAQSLRNARGPIETSIEAIHERPGIAGYLTKLFQGWQPTKAPGGRVIGYVRKLWRIDRNRSPKWYRERVERADDGVVIRDVDEPLRQHRGRGSARRIRH